MPKFVERITAQTFASAASTAIDVFVSGDSNARIAVDAGGKLTWGSGSGAGDVTLYRSAANALKRKKEERKAQPATDAGARARQKLKDKEHNQYVNFLSAPTD